MAGLAPPSQPHLVGRDLRLEVDAAERGDRLLGESGLARRRRPGRPAPLRGSRGRRAPGSAGRRAGPRRSWVTMTVVMTWNSLFTARRASRTRAADPSPAPRSARPPTGSTGCSTARPRRNALLAARQHAGRASRDRPGRRDRAGRPRRASAPACGARSTAAGCSRAPRGRERGCGPCPAKRSRPARAVLVSSSSSMGRVAALDLDDARRGTVEAADEVQDRGLPGAARSHHREELGGMDVEVDARRATTPTSPDVRVARRRTSASALGPVAVGADDVLDPRPPRGGRRSRRRAADARIAPARRRSRPRSRGDPERRPVHQEHRRRVRHRDARTDVGHQGRSR